MSKYGNKPVWVAKNGETFNSIAITSQEWKKQGNLWFASKLEYLVYLAIISFARKSKLTVDITQQYKYELVANNHYPNSISWVIDFYCKFKNEHGEYIESIYVEAKGLELPEYRLKRDLLGLLYPSDFAKLFIIKNHEHLDDLLFNFFNKE